MTLFFAVRHGETEGNKNKIYRGRWDLPLNEAGHEQVERAGKALGGIDLDAIYHSPLERTRQTAAAVARWQEVEPVPQDFLIDIDYGAWTKAPDSQVAGSQPELYRQWKESPGKVVFPDGEGLGDVRARVEPGLVRLAEKHPGQKVALCGHRVSVKMILLIALGLPDASFWRVQVDTASISLLEHRAAGFKLVFANETSHLKSLADKLGTGDF